MTFPLNIVELTAFVLAWLRGGWGLNHNFPVDRNCREESDSRAPACPGHGVPVYLRHWLDRERARRARDRIRAPQRELARSLTVVRLRSPMSHGEGMVREHSPRRRLFLSHSRRGDQNAPTLDLLFAVAAVAGLTMAAMHFKNASPPRPVLAVLHGLFAASGLVVLLLAVIKVGMQARWRSLSACWWLRCWVASDC